MKKLNGILFVCVIGLAACGNQNTTTSDTTSISSVTESQSLLDETSSRAEEETNTTETSSEDSITSLAETSPQEAEISIEETSATEILITEASNIETSSQKSEEPETTAISLSGFIFPTSNGVQIGMHQDIKTILEQLGEPKSYLETPSCAFPDSIDKIYTYPDFTLTTYSKNGNDYIYDIYFDSGSSSTKEGISIGSSLDEITKAYGDNYTEEFGLYTYTKDGMRLMFLTEDNIVTSIEYSGLTK